VAQHLLGSVHFSDVGSSAFGDDVDSPRTGREHSAPELLSSSMSECGAPPPAAVGKDTPNDSSDSLADKVLIVLGPREAVCGNLAKDAPNESGAPNERYVPNESEEPKFPGKLGMSSERFLKRFELFSCSTMDGRWGALELPISAPPGPRELRVGCVCWG